MLEFTLTKKKYQPSNIEEHLSSLEGLYKRCESVLSQLGAFFTGRTAWCSSVGMVADYVARSYAGKSILVGDASIRHGQSTTLEMAHDVCD
ncbi:hypothetical protein [Pseudomonas sp. S1_H07]